MSKKKILVIVLSCVLTAVLCVGVSFAIWGNSTTTNTETGVDSGDWVETEKYINFSVIYNEGTSEQIGWSVVGLNNPQQTITVPKQHKASTTAQSYPVMVIASSFSNISGLKQINLPNTIKVVQPNAFARCSDLKIFNIATGATFTIGNTAFSACDMLEKFNYGGSTIESIGIDAFMGCSKLSPIPTC